MVSTLAPGHGSLQLGAYADPSGYGAYGQYMQRLRLGPSLFARGDLVRGGWSARAGLAWEW